jgi:hypothetical protein
MNVSGRVMGFHLRDGVLQRVISGDNLVTTTGRVLIRDLVKTAAPGTKPSHYAVGDDGTVVTAADTDLAAELTSITRVALSEIAFADTYALTYYGTITNDSGGTETVREFGIFNNAASGPASGDMLARFLCQEFTFENNDEVLMYWVLTFGDD